MKSTFPAAFGAAILCVLSAGCAKKVVAVNTPPPPAVRSEAPVTAERRPAAATPQTPATPRPVVATAASRTPDAATKLRIQDLLNRIQDAYFDYNQQNIRPDATAALKVDAQALSEILRQYPDYKLTVEGYCDERGSDQYNLALGDARAKRARTFLADSGIPESQVRVISYGKEHPVCDDHTEACWQRNRRAHITQNQ